MNLSKLTWSTLLVAGMISLMSATGCGGDKPAEKEEPAKKEGEAAMKAGEAAKKEVEMKVETEKKDK